MIIFDTGNIFGGGQMLNQSRGLPGKASAQNIRKDEALLASLGVKDPQIAKVTKVDKLLGRVTRCGDFSPKML